MNNTKKLFRWSEILAILISHAVYTSDKKLLIIDLDETIIGTTNFIGSDSWFSKEKYVIEQDIPNRSFDTVTNLIKYHTANLCRYEYELVDEKIPFYMALLDNYYDIYVLTARGNKSEKDTVNQLDKFDLNKYLKSIIYCDGKHKGCCLKEALSLKGDEEIYFIDDKQCNIDAIKGVFTNSYCFCLELRDKAMAFERAI